MKKLLLTVPLSFLLLTSVGCGNTKQEETASSSSIKTEQSSTAKEETVAIKMSIIEDEKEVSSKELNVPKDQSVLDILKENFDVKEEKGFVTEIDGKKQQPSDNKYWMYYINDKETSKGANDIYPSEKDDIQWRLNAFK
ncbi:MAG: DUF4430 domain-containing protein [Vagococcus sp.]